MVIGRFGHVNFIWEPAPIPVRVTEGVPPHPPKLLAQAEQAVSYDEDLPPIELLFDAVDMHDLAAHPTGEYLLPCRGSGTELGAPVAFLNTPGGRSFPLTSAGRAHDGASRRLDRLPPWRLELAANARRMRRFKVRGTRFEDRDQDSGPPPPPLHYPVS